MEQPHQLLLEFRPQVNQHIAAGDEVQPRERRVLDEAVHREEAHLAQLFLHLVRVVLLDEEALQALGGHVLGDAHRVDAAAGGLQRLRVNVGGKHLDVRHHGERVHVLTQEDGERVGFFPGRAAGDAHAHLVVGALVREQLGDDRPRQGREGLRVAEEVRHSDEQVLEEKLEFVGVLPEALDVGSHGVELQRLHAALQAAVDRALLVLAKVMAGLAPEQPIDRGQVLAHLLAEAVGPSGRGARSGAWRTR